MFTKVVSLFAALAIIVPSIASAGDAGSVTDGDRGAIRTVIESQLDAFQRDDAKLAFSFASPRIQAKFGSPDTFISMVRSGYQPVYRPRRFEFLEVRSMAGKPVQEVFFIGPDGSEVIGLYMMAKQPNGAWRIDGVYLVRPNDEGA